MEILKRYFKRNTAHIFRIRYAGYSSWKRSYLPVNGANFKGFYLSKFYVTWRKPYSKIWEYDDLAKDWRTK